MTDGDDVICNQLVSCHAVMCERKQNMHNEKQKASLGQRSTHTESIDTEEPVSLTSEELEVELDTSTDLCEDTELVRTETEKEVLEDGPKEGLGKLLLTDEGFDVAAEPPVVPEGVPPRLKYANSD